MSHEDLKEKVVIVTGSSAGIGEAIAIQFAKNDSRIVINGRNEQNLQRVATLCMQASPSNRKPLINVGDLSKQEDAQNLVKQAVEFYGKVDVLVNNAGFVSISDISDDDFMTKYDSVMNLNARSALLMCRLSLPYLIESKGCIVNIGSVTSTRHDFDGGLHYAMSKGAMESMTKYLSYELAPKGVRVNGIRPGMIRSTIHTKMNLPESAFDEFSKNYPMRRAGDSEEVASAVCFLSSKSASYITGELLVVDGGYQVM